MSYALQFLPSAKKAMARLSPPDRRRIDKHVLALAENPRPQGAVPLKGDLGLWRLRVGDYRIIYHIRDRELVIIVVDVGHRREVYRRM